MAEIVDMTSVRRASVNDAADVRARTAPASPSGDALIPLTTLAVSPWRELSARAIEPNGYYLPGWELAVNASAQGRTGASALSAWDDASSPGRDAAAIDRPDAGRLTVVRLPDPAARTGERPSLRYALHAACSTATWLMRPSPN